MLDDGRDMEVEVQERRRVSISDTTSPREAVPEASTDLSWILHNANIADDHFVHTGYSASRAFEAVSLQLAG
jgi:hypothetical protein